MIITRTPFRVSLCGGGTDFPAWFKDRGGAVVSLTIDKFCYVTLRQLQPFFSYRSRFIYSKVEEVNALAEIVHPAIRGCLRFLGQEDPHLGMHHDADLPAQSGLGSSAAFTVGLLRALYALAGYRPTARELTNDAITVDQDYAGDVCGVQDQIAVARGGLNLLQFGPGDRYSYAVEPLTVDLPRLHDHLSLFYVNSQTRRSSDIEASKTTQDNTKLLLEQAALVDPCLQALRSGDMRLLGRVVSRSWALKRQMAPGVSNDRLDGYVSRAMAAGAYGVKLCGAGGGGSILVVAPPKNRQAVVEALSDIVHVPFKIEGSGSQVIYQSAIDKREAKSA